MLASPLVLSSVSVTVRNLNWGRWTMVAVVSQYSLQSPTSPEPSTNEKETTYLSVLVKDVSKESEGIRETL